MARLATGGQSHDSGDSAPGLRRAAMEITIVENLQRADLNPMEQARALNGLRASFT